MNKKVLIGMHSVTPAPIWTDPHEAPAKNLFGCVNRWQQLTRLTQYDKIDAFNNALEVFTRWSGDIRTERVVMDALWNSPTISKLEEQSQHLLQKRIEEIQGGFKRYQGDGPPPAAAWGESNWAPLPADLQAQLKAQEEALKAAKN